MVSAFLLIAATLQGVNAWGTLGHATIAYIAQNYVTDEVATWFVPRIASYHRYQQAD